MTSSYVDEATIQAEYAPYHLMRAFRIGYGNVMERRDWIHHHYTGVDEQAYDRGVEAACRVRRAAEWVERNVGSN